MADTDEPEPDDALARALEENRRRSEAIAESYGPPMRQTERPAASVMAAAARRP